MSELKLYRQRYIPQEIIFLKDDIIVSHTEDTLITTWKTLNPKTAFSHGASCYFLKEGFKLSKFYKHDGTLLYYYCDILEFVENPEENSLTTIDLLADVVVYPDGTMNVLDLDELADAFDSTLINASQLTNALRKLDHLLTIIRQNHFEEYTNILNHLGL